MKIHRLKHSFTAGELSPLMHDRVDFDRYKNGCRKLYNAVCATQGPSVRRPGFRFIYDLNLLGLDVTNPQVREVPFIFNELQAYTMVFFRHTDGSVRVVFGSGDGLVAYSSPAITECPPGTPVTPTPGDIVVLTLPSEWDIERFDWAQSADEMYIAQSGLAPKIIKRWDHECWELAAMGFTDMPTDWSDINGWPERVTFHQQRIAFAANNVRTQTVWLSKAGDFSDFGISSPLGDADAITFTLDSGTQNKIKWITSSKTLNVGTLGNEWTVQGSTQSALTPSNILAQRQTNSGSEANKPLLVGLTTLFVERHGRAINEFVYDYSFDGYKTSDMSILAPHLTEHYSIIDWTYQQTPDSIIWCVREDGLMLGITYQRDHKVIGWHEHDTQGAFKAVTAIPGDTREDDVWVVVKRIIDGADKYYVEKMEDWFKSDDAVDARFLDSASVYEGTPVSELTGFNHLVNTEVSILADGSVHPNKTVNASGELTLNNTYSTVVVGLPYVTETQPNLADIPTENGTSLGRMQRASELLIDFYRTINAEVVAYHEDGTDTVEEVPFRTPADLTGQQVPLYSQWYDWDYPEGHDREVKYGIRQRSPLPMTIRSIIDVVEVHE